MNIFKKVDFNKITSTEEKIKTLYYLLGNLETKKIGLLNKIKSTEDLRLRQKLEEQFKELCEHAEEIETHLVGLDKEERQATVTDLNRIRKIQKMRERAAELKQRQKVPQKLPQQQTQYQKRKAA